MGNAGEQLVMEPRSNPLTLDERVDGQLDELEVAAEPLVDDIPWCEVCDPVGPPLATLPGVSVREADEGAVSRGLSKPESVALDVTRQLFLDEVPRLLLPLVISGRAEGSQVNRGQRVSPTTDRRSVLDEACLDRHASTIAARPGRFP